MNLIVPGDPVPWARARRNGGRYFTPERQRAQAQAILAYWRANQAPTFAGPIEVALTFYMRRPLGQYGTGRNAGRVKSSAPAYPTARVDVDNLAKLVLDALEGHAWEDDCQVVSLRATKSYGSPHTVVMARAASRPRGEEEG